MDDDDNEKRNRPLIFAGRVCIYEDRDRVARPRRDLRLNHLCFLTDSKRDIVLIAFLF